MKKLICLVLLILLLCSCSQEKQAEVTTQAEIQSKPIVEHEYGFSLVNAPESDIESSPFDVDLGLWFGLETYTPAAQTDGCLYYIVENANSNMIYCYDRETEEATSLCKKENCNHDSKECPFYGELKMGVEMLNCYNGKLWWVSGEKLYSCDLDGSDTALMRDLGDEFINEAIIHRGYLYFKVQDSEMEGITSAYMGYLLKRVPLEDPAAPIETIFHKVANRGENWSGEFVPCGDMVYIIIYEVSRKSEYDYLYRYDAISGGEAELLYSGDLGEAMGVSPEGEMRYEYQNGIYRFNEESRAPELVFRIPEDDENLYRGRAYFANDVIVLEDSSGYENGTGIGYSIYSYNGDLISKGAFKDIEGLTPPETENCFVHYMGATSDKLFFTLYFTSGNTYTKGPKNETYTFIAEFPKFEESTPRMIYSYHYIYTGDTTIKLK